MMPVILGGNISILHCSLFYTCDSWRNYMTFVYCGSPTRKYFNLKMQRLRSGASGARWGRKRVLQHLQMQICFMQHASYFVSHECCTARACVVAGVRHFILCLLGHFVQGGKEASPIYQSGSRHGNSRRRVWSFRRRTMCQLCPHRLASQSMSLTPWRRGTKEVNIADNAHNTSAVIGMDYVVLRRRWSRLGAAFSFVHYSLFYRHQDTAITLRCCKCRPAARSNACCNTRK